MRQYKLSFQFFDTKNEAMAFCNSVVLEQNAYAKRKYPPRYTPWTNKDGSEHKFVVTYYCN